MKAPEMSRITTCRRYILSMCFNAAGMPVVHHWLIRLQTTKVSKSSQSLDICRFCPWTIWRVDRRNHRCPESLPRALVTLRWRNQADQSTVSDRRLTDLCATGRKVACQRMRPGPKTLGCCTMELDHREGQGLFVACGKPDQCPVYMAARKAGTVIKANHSNIGWSTYHVRNQVACWHRAGAVPVCKSSSVTRVTKALTT